MSTKMIKEKSNCLLAENLRLVWPYERFTRLFDRLRFQILIISDIFWRVPIASGSFCATSSTLIATSAATSSALSSSSLRFYALISSIFRQVSTISASCVSALPLSAHDEAVLVDNLRGGHGAGGRRKDRLHRPSDHVRNGQNKVKLAKHTELDQFKLCETERTENWEIAAKGFTEADKQA